MKKVKVLLLLGTCVKFFVKEVKVLLGTSLSLKNLVNIPVMDVVLLQCRNYKPAGQNPCELVLFC